MTSTLTPRVPADRVREPWHLYVDGAILTVRGSVARDLPAVALMHGRCSAKTLLDRYRAGGRAPAVAIMERHVRDPLSFVVAAGDGRVVGTARVAPDVEHSWGSGELSLLVEDAWQQLGIGRRLLRHVAAAAALSGYRQLVSYPGTTGGIVQRMVSTIGTTRVIADPHRHLHTALPETARLGLGSLHASVGRAPVESISG